jgi:hypothetical protein
MSSICAHVMHGGDALSFCRRRFGRASAPMIPHLVHTMRGLNVGTGTWSGHASTFKTARWWHCQQDTKSERTPLARMLPSVIGSIGLVR